VGVERGPGAGHGAPFIDSGPNSSSGTEKRVSRRSKYRPPVRRARRRESSLLAVPGGPSSSRCSPASAAKIIRRTCAPARRARSAARADGLGALAVRQGRVSRLRLTLQQALLHVAHGGEHPLLQLAAGPRVSDLCGSRGACRPAQRTR